MNKHIFLIGLILLSSCKKDFLEKKSDKALTVPESLGDYWALLDNREVMQLTPGMGQVASDDQYYSYSYWSSLSAVVRNSYIWAVDIYEGSPGTEWATAYQKIYYANCVFDGLSSYPVADEVSELLGSALFFRAYAFYNLAEIFAKPYSSAAAGDLGVPLRLSSDLSEKSHRASLQQTYDQILADLLNAKDMVPKTLTANISRPSKLAVTALLSRIYLNMGNFSLAEAYADSTLTGYDALLDYNTVDRSSNGPFSGIRNPEVLYESVVSNLTSLSNRTNTIVDSVLLSSYREGDLRKEAFFRINPDGQYYFKGRYTDLAFLFSGLATDEVYLNRAECRARRGDASGAMADINLLLEHRWSAAEGSRFVPYQISDAEQALEIVLLERRKELLFRGLRWSDLRRLNREPDRQIVVLRNLNGTEYRLEPNSNRYVFPIPMDEISLSAIEQNER